MFHVDLPIDTQDTSEVSPSTLSLLCIHKTIGCVHKRRPRKGKTHSATCFTHT